MPRLDVGGLQIAVDDAALVCGLAFWPDDVSLCDPGGFKPTVGHRALTDVYLLALARAHDGRLATFDRSIPVEAVPGARPGHLVVVDA